MYIVNDVECRANVDDRKWVKIKGLFILILHMYVFMLQDLLQVCIT